MNIKKFIILAKIYNQKLLFKYYKQSKLLNYKYF